MDAEDEETSKDKDIDKLMALISLSFKKIYKPTNNNLRTSSNTSRANQDNSSRINRNAGYENQRIGNVAGARETLGSTVVQKSGIQCYNCKEFRLVARECQKPKRAKDAAYHREKMLPCKQEEAGIQFLQMLLTLDLSLMMNHYKREEIDQNDDDNDLAKERELLASLIEKLKCEIHESKNRNKFLKTSNKALIEKLKELKDKLYAHQETISILSKQKEAQIKLYKTREDKELDKVIELENKVKVLDNIVYKTGQSVQTMNMLNNKCRTSFAKPEFLKKAQRANPRLYDIGCYNDNLALTLSPDSDEVIRLEKESRSKLSNLIRPFDYDKLNNLYDLFVPQREKSSKQRYFSERSRLSHINVNNRKSKESFNNQTTLLEKRMDESIPLDKQCQSSLENFKVKSNVNMIITGVELCKQKIANRTCLNEEMVADLRYFNSLESEVDSLRSQLETQKT
nr:hypothetical protein [Tanacetum cinerariifolium]